MAATVPDKMSRFQKPIGRVAKHMVSATSWLRARCSRTGVAVGYYNVPNFGDQLTPDVLAHFGLTGFHCPDYRYADCIGVGSILHMVSPNFGGAILGSGFIREKDGRRLKRARIYLVRGELTRDALGAIRQLAIGDPGLLVPELYDIPDRSRPSGKVGLVPHYSDCGNEILAELDNRVWVIDIRQPPRNVVQQIASCDAVLSSSLHGLVVADALGIPSRQVVLSGRLIGADFKFRDYYSCYGIVPNPLKLRGDEAIEDLIGATQLVDRGRTKELQISIHNAYETYAREVVEKVAGDQ